MNLPIAVLSVGKIVMSFPLNEQREFDWNFGFCLVT